MASAAHAKDLSRVATLAGLYNEDGTLCSSARLCASFLALHLQHCSPQQLRLLIARVACKEDESKSNTSLLLARSTCGAWVCSEEDDNIMLHEKNAATECKEFVHMCVPMTDVVSWMAFIDCLHMPCDIEKDTLHTNVRLPLMRSFVKQTKCREDSLGVHHTQDLCRLYLVKGLAAPHVLRRISQNITNGSLALAEWVTQPIEHISDRVYRSMDAAEALISECFALAAMMRVSTHNERTKHVVFDASARARQTSEASTQCRHQKNTCAVLQTSKTNCEWNDFFNLLVARKYPATLALLLYCCVNIEQEHKSSACLMRYAMEEDENTQFRAFRHTTRRIDAKQWGIVCAHLGNITHLNRLNGRAYKTAAAWLQQIPTLHAFQNVCGDALSAEATALAYMCLYQREWRELWQEATLNNYRLPYLSEALEDTMLSWRRTHQLDMFTMDRLQAIILGIESAQ